MKARVCWSAILLLTCTSLVALAQQQHSQKCIAHTKGSYGYSCAGVAPNPIHNFVTEPFAAYGVVTSDDKGQWNGGGKVSFNGTVLPWTHNTRQTEPSVINPDCSGSVTYEVTVGGNAVPDAHFEFVIVDEGREIKGFPVDQGYAATCQLILEKESHMP